MGESQCLAPHDQGPSTQKLTISTLALKLSVSPIYYPLVTATDGITFIKRKTIADEEVAPLFNVTNVELLFPANKLA